LKWKPTLILFIFLFSIIPLKPVIAQEDITPIANDAYYFEGIDAEVGDKSVSGFKPHILLGGWKGEVQLSLGFDDSQVLIKSVKVENDVIKWETPTFDFHYYQLSSKKQLEYDGLEFEIILKQKPLTNRWSFPIKADDLVFYYQPPLNEESWPIGYTANATHAFNDKGKLVAYRPRNVIGSYAVFHESKRDNQYTTGKLWHIYTPHLEDSEGNEDWGTLNITNDVFTTILPQKFLDTAKYPIIVDPSFGKDDVGGTESYFADGGYEDTLKAVLTEDGSVYKITAYIKKNDAGGTINVKTGIYDDSGGAPNNLEGESNIVVVGDSYSWVDFTASIGLSAATYHLAVIMSGDLGIVYDSGSAGDWWYVAATYPTFNNPFGSGNSGDVLWSIYANYTTGGQSYERNPTQSISWSSSIDRTWSLVRGLTQSLTLTWNAYGIHTAFEQFVRTITLAVNWASSISRRVDFHRAFSQSLTFTWNALGTKWGEWIRNLSLSINWSSSLTRRVDFHKTASQTVTFVFNLPGLVIDTLRVWVRNLQNVTIESALVTILNPSSGMIEWVNLTNATGYTPEYEMDHGNYTITVSMEEYQTYNRLFEFNDTRVYEVQLTGIGESVGWNILSMIGIIFMGLIVMTFAKKR